MTINITPEIQTAYRAYLDHPVDADFTGNTIRRRDTYPFIGNEAAGMVDFAAGFQAARNAGVTAAVPALPDPLGCRACTHPDCGRYDGPKQVECHAMCDNACARPATYGVPVPVSQPKAPSGTDGGPHG